MQNKEIGDRLRALRGKKTQSEVAEALGVSTVAVCLWESGRRMPKHDMMQKIAAYYKKSVKYIFFS